MQPLRHSGMSALQRQLNRESGQIPVPPLGPTLLHALFPRYGIALALTRPDGEDLLFPPDPIPSPSRVGHIPRSSERAAWRVDAGL